MEHAGIYIHVPYCRGKCRYCSFVSTINLSTQRSYLSSLEKEISAWEIPVIVDTLYFGGGTPSCLERGGISAITDMLRKKFVFSDGAEITVEANPESADDGFFEECRAAGVNRVSLGLQCANDEVLKKAGRLHTVADFVAAIGRARDAGLENISADLILGLEGESRVDVASSLKLLVDLGVPHVSIYSLSVEKGCIMYSAEYRPDEDSLADEYCFASGYLRGCGYDRYEISNFAKNGMIGKHNTGYWLHKPYLGFGPAAHSWFGGERFFNTENVAAYLNGTTRVSAEKISVEQFKEEYVMLRLRLSRGIDLSEYEKLFSRRLTDDKRSQIDRLVGYGVIEISDGRLYATEKGVYVLNQIITELI